MLSAIDGPNAFRLLNETMCDVVLSSYRLPEFDGSTLSARIRRASQLSDIYIIQYWPDGEECAPREADTAGPDDILSSPLKSAEIRMRLRTAERFLTVRRALAQQNARLSDLAEQLGDAFYTLETDLQAASTIQLGLLPTVSQVHPSVTVDWLILPSSFLTGDNLNYFLVQDRYLIFYHLDVAGHGIPSALMSVTLNQLLAPQPGNPLFCGGSYADSPQLGAPIDVVDELNRRFLEQDVGYFTMIYGILDISTREVRMCQAGHPSPLLLRTDGTISSIGDGGFPVGLWPDVTYEETTTRLLPGERLVLFSDGLLLPHDLERDAFSLQKLEQILTETARLSIKETLRIIQAHLVEWTRENPLPDDVSIMIIQGNECPNEPSY